MKKSLLFVPAFLFATSAIAAPQSFSVSWGAIARID